MGVGAVAGLLLVFYILYKMSVEKINISKDCINYENGKTMICSGDYPEDSNLAFDTNGPVMLNTYLELAHHYPTIPKNIFYVFPELEILKIHSNHIAGLDSEYFENGYNLKELYFWWTKINYIPSQVFNELRSLQKLDLSDNQISLLEPSSFFGLNELKELNLSGNQIVVLPFGIFQYLEHLVNINMRDNWLKEISGDIFANNQNLKTISLEANFIKNINGGEFRNLNLSHFKIDGNQLEEVVFRGKAENFCASNCNIERLLIHGGVENLKAGDNQIKELFIEDQKALKTIEMDTNHLPNIRNISDAENLVVLDLRNNEILDLDADSFKNLKNLKRLEMSLKNLRNFTDIDIFLPLKNLKFVNITDLNCLPQTIYSDALKRFVEDVNGQNNL